MVGGYHSFPAMSAVRMMLRRVIALTKSCSSKRKVQLKSMGVSKNRGKKPKMDGFIMENPMNKWMIWGYHFFWKHPP